MAALIVLGCLAASISVPLIWLHEIVLDTDRYVETVAPLSEDPAIKDAVAAYATDELFQQVNAEELAREALPQRAEFLADPLVGMLNGFVNEQARKVLDSEQFSRLWRESNRKAHEMVLGVLTGEGGTLQAEEGKIILDLGGVLQEIKDRLAATGFFLFQDDGSRDSPGGRFTIFESPQISKVQEGIDILNRLALWLPFLALLFWGAGLWLAHSRRLAVFWIGLGLAIGMAVLQVGLGIGRTGYLDAVGQTGAVDQAAAASFFDIIVSSLKSSIRNTFAAGLLVAAAAFIAGPSSVSVKLRAGAVKIYHAARDTRARIDLGPAGAWVHAQKNILRGLGAAVALLIIFFMDEFSIERLSIILLVLLAYLGGLEFIARKAA